MHTKLDLNLQPVKSTHYLGPKTYWINIVTLGIVKNLFKHAINIFVSLDSSPGTYSHHMNLKICTAKYFFQ